MCCFWSSSNSPVSEEGRTGRRRLSYAVKPVAAFPATQPTSSSGVVHVSPLRLLQLAISDLQKTDCRLSEPSPSSDTVQSSPLQLAISNLQPTDCRSSEAPSTLRRRPRDTR
ncbi:hypothetical protein TIFTF001_022711 [Ficus carica]|uniref:Uncharacterized protein n=1 Tax=Ficus carica TaxID=3494 RepID=A0AA88AMD7_FICCA|nr:hypothetical protein TIFTF001_022711 [Ficus carica]